MFAILKSMRCLIGSQWSCWRRVRGLQFYLFAKHGPDLQNIIHLVSSALRTHASLCSFYDAHLTRCTHGVRQYPWIINKQLLNVTESELSCGQYFSSTPYHQKRLCSIHERLISGLEKQCFKDFWGFLKVFRFIYFLNFLNFIKRF